MLGIIPIFLTEIRPLHFSPLLMISFLQSSGTCELETGLKQKVRGPLQKFPTDVKHPCLLVDSLAKITCFFLRYLAFWRKLLASDTFFSMNVLEDTEFGGKILHTHLLETIYVSLKPGQENIFYFVKLIHILIILKE